MKKVIAFIMTLCMVLGLSSVGVWADEATWKLLPPMPTGLSETTASVIDGKAYIISGGSAAGTFNKVFIFEGKSESWSIGKSLLPTPRNEATASVVGSNIYVIGGGSLAESVTNVMEVYNTTTDTWSKGPSMPSKSIQLTSSVIGSKIYAIGGSLGRYPTNVMEIYDTETNAWIDGTPMPTARAALTSAVVGNKIYVIGGYNSSSKLNTLEIYDSITNTWSTGPSMPTARGYLTSSVVGNKIYVIGGVDSDSLATVEIYDTETDTWSTGPSMLSQRHYLTSFVINNKIYAIGGHNYSDRVESLQVGSKPTDPGQSFNLTATGGNSKVDLSWGAVTDATSYTVKRSTTAGGSYTVIAENITGTTYTDTDVTNGTTYYYVVTAVNSTGESTNSNEASATPQEGSGGETGSKALLVITMTNGLEKEYELSMTEINKFIDWYDSKAASNGYYKINKNFNLGPFVNRTDYLTFDKIQNFEVMQYN